MIRGESTPAEILAGAVSGELADLLFGPMDAQGAAGFLGLSEDAFRRLAPSLPRHKRAGMGHRYLRSELLAWLISGDVPRPEGDHAGDPGGDPGDAAGNTRRQRRQPAGNAGSQILTDAHKKRAKEKVKRLV